MLLAPILGPVIGGAIVSSANWRWTFFVNLPVGVIAFVLDVRLLRPVPAEAAHRDRR